MVAGDYKETFSSGHSRQRHTRTHSGCDSVCETWASFSPTGSQQGQRSWSHSQTQATGLEPSFAAGRRRDSFLEECSIEEVSQSPVEESTQPKTSRQYKSVLEELKTKTGSWVGREAGEFGKS